MDLKFFFQAIIKFLASVICIGLVIFIPAGTLNYWNGWLFMVLLFVPMFFAGIALMIKNPDLLMRRLNSKEKEKEQKIVILLSGVMFLSIFVVAGLNYRYSWIQLPNTVVLTASVIFVIAYILYAVVLRENEYLSRTIEVEENQRVVNTGLYAVVRHPMYSATILLFLSMPLILGSIISFAIALSYLFIIIKRIKNEEAVLEKELQGYTEYKKKVKYKLIPFIF